MMKRIITGISVVFMLLFSISFAEGQSFYNQRQNRTLVLTAGTGTAHYFGDLVDDWYFTINGNFTAGARYPVYDRLYVAADVTWFRLAAQDEDSEIKALRGLSFFSDNFELAATLQFNLFDDPARFYQRKMFNPYLFAGIGLLYYQPKTRYQGDKYALRPLQTEGVSYSPVTMSFPLGIGLKYKLNAFINITLEGGLRYTLTDYLDDVSSGVYPDPASFEDPLARALSDRSAEAGASVPFALEPRDVRGNPGRRDAYMLILLRGEYYLSPLRDSFRSMFYRGNIRRKRRR